MMAFGGIPVTPMTTGRTPLPLLRLTLALACGAFFAGALANASAAGVGETKSLHVDAELSQGAFGLIPYPALDDGPIKVTHGPGGLVETSGTVAIQDSLQTPIFYPYTLGSVDFVALQRNRRMSGSIAVSLMGYTPGIYTVSAITRSSMRPVVLGPVTVLSGSAPFVVEYGWDYFPLSAISSGTARFGTGGAAFPKGFDPLDVAMVTVSGSSGITTATLNPTSNVTFLFPSGYLTELSPVTPGPLARGAAGYALVRAVTPPGYATPATAGAGAGSSSVIIILSGSGTLPGSGFVPPNPPTGRIVLHAHGLPASTEVTYAVDGTDLGTKSTDSAGNLEVYESQGAGGKLPSTLNLFSVTAMTVHDDRGNLYLSVGF